MIKEWLKRIREYPALVDELAQTHANLQEQVEENLILKDALIQKVTRSDKEDLEEYWNNKRQKKLITWHARDGVKMDVRCFFQTDETLPKFTGTNNEIVADTLAWTILNIRYQQEKGEFW